MWLRILFAAILGGTVAFFMGAFNHMVLGLQGRTMANVPQSVEFSEQIRTRGVKQGMHVFPDMPTAADQKDAEKMKAINERYKAGPSGLLIVAPTGEDMMGPETLGKELVTNVIGALIASWIVSLIPADAGLFRRWFAVLLMGVLGWVSITASYGIWYRFPPDFVHDELYCALLEWGVAGLVIAAIVRRSPAVAPVSSS
jgi:hypothetical protein